MLFVIKRLVNLEDFKRVFRVFEAPPYNEVWADTDLLSEFNLLNSQGYIFGCYLDNFCIGLISIRDKLDSDNHAVNYSNKKVIYLSDMVVLPKFRHFGIATRLLLYVLDFAKKLDYEIMYMRTLQPGKSMSYNLVVKNGFKEVKNAVEIVTHERTDSLTNQSDARIFLDINLKEIPYRNTINGTNSQSFGFKEIIFFDDFYPVFNSYSDPPYCEIWSKDEILQEFLDIINRGYIFGYYLNDTCVSLLALKTAYPYEHPVAFDFNCKVLFLSDLITTSSFRNQSIELGLLNYSIDYAKKSNVDYMYLRTLESDNSSHYEIFKKIGFTIIPDACQTIERPRYRALPNSDCRQFMQLHLSRH